MSFIATRFYSEKTLLILAKALQLRPAVGSPPARDRAPPWLKTTLVQAAWAAVRTKGSYLQAQFLRPKSRCGPKKAISAATTPHSPSA